MKGSETNETGRNVISSEQEAAASTETNSPEIVCHISTSSSSSSNSDPGLFARTSSSGVDIVEIIDWMGENSNSDSGPEPVVTVVEDDSSQRRPSLASVMSVTDLPLDISSNTHNVQVAENDGDSPMEVEEITAEPSNNEEVPVTSEELLETIEEETMEEEPIITTQVCISCVS